MDIQTLAGSPRNERGGGQVSRLLLAAGQFGSRQLSVTWVEYVSATSPPFEAAITGQTWEIPHVRL
jgi:hypothetical protein